MRRQASTSLRSRAPGSARCGGPAGRGVVKTHRGAADAGIQRGLDVNRPLSRAANRPLGQRALGLCLSLSRSRPWKKPRRSTSSQHLLAIEELGARVARGSSVKQRLLLLYRPIVFAALVSACGADPITSVPDAGPNDGGIADATTPPSSARGPVVFAPAAGGHMQSASHRATLSVGAVTAQGSSSNATYRFILHRGGAR